MNKPIFGVTKEASEILREMKEQTLDGSILKELKDENTRFTGIDEVGVVLGIIFIGVVIVGFGIYLAMLKSQMCKDLGIIMYSHWLTWSQCLAL